MQGRGQTPHALYDVTLVSNTELSARVPAGLVVGLYDLTLNAPLGVAESLPEALAVVAESSAIMGRSCKVDADCAADPCVTVPICLAGACVYAKDSDADGHIDGACGGDDCDDDPATCGSACFPGNAEVCDLADNDCDGRIDESGNRADAENRAGTHDSHFAGVWHLNEASGALFDATARTNDGEPMGGLAQGAVGMIGPTCDLAGPNAYVRVADDPSLTLTSDWTIETWVNVNTFGTGRWQALVSKDVDDNNHAVRPASLWIYEDRVDAFVTHGAEQRACPR